MQNMIGIYGDWACRLAPDPPQLSFRRSEWKDVDSWRKQARRRYRGSLIQPDIGSTPQAIMQRHFEYDGLSIEQINWQLPYGLPTDAVVLQTRQSFGSASSNSRAARSRWKQVFRFT